MLSRKNYNLIAEIIKHSTDKRSVAIALALYFRADNSRFSIDKFLVACGVEKESSNGSV